MSGGRFAFPPSQDAVFLTDGGLETTLVFLDGVDLPCFASFPLLQSEEGRMKLENYFRPYIRTAVERDVGFILDTPSASARHRTSLTQPVNSLRVRLLYLRPRVGRILRARPDRGFCQSNSPLPPLGSSIRFIDSTYFDRTSKEHTK